MSDVSSGVELTPQENAYFENKGAVPDSPPETEQAEKPVETSEQVKDKIEPEKEEKAEKVVPLAALHEERNRRKEIERKHRETELENARFRERFEILAKSTSSEKPPPKPEEDIFGALDHTGKRVEQIERSLLEQRQAYEQENHTRQLVSSYHADAQRFARETQDFGDAYSFLLSSRDKELQALGFIDPIRRTQATQNDELQVVALAMQNGLSPAEAVYNLAIARGYTRKDAAKEAKGVTAAEKLATVANGQAANKSLASAGGSAGAEEMTPQRLLDMPNDEFEKWCNKHPKQARQLMGG